MMPKLRTKNNALTAYAFACGYIETRPLKTPGGNATLFRDGVWHVQARDDERSRFIWECFDTLTDARAFFRTVVRKEST